MIAANSDEDRDVGRDVGEAAGLAELGPRDQRDRAAADAVEQRDHLRHRGHLHLARRGHADGGADRRGRATIRPQLPIPGISSVATTAIAMPTAAMRLPRTAVRGPVSPHQPVDEQAEGDDVEERDEVGAPGRRRRARSRRARSSPSSTRGAGLLLNISSMRSVTRKPPTTLIVPKTIAITSSSLVERRRSSPRPSTRMPPSTTIPWIALVPDISGVCSVFGHLRDHRVADEAGQHEDREVRDEVRSSAWPPCLDAPRGRSRRRA